MNASTTARGVPWTRPAAIGITVATLLGLSVTSLQAVVLTGSLRTSIYSQESRLGAKSFETRLDAEGSPIAESERSPLENRTRLLERVRLDALQLGHPNLSFHTAFSAANVLTHQSLGDTRFRLYRGYLRFASPSGSKGWTYEARAGRTWVLAGVGSRVIDGLSLRTSRCQAGDLTLYFGTLGSDRITRTDRFWSLESPSDSRAYGARLRMNRALGPLDPHLAVSWARTERTPHEEIVTDGERIGVHGDFRLLRGRAGHRFLETFRVWGDYRGNLLNGRWLMGAYGIEHAGDWRALRAGLEYRARRPDLRSTSYFASFDTEPVEEIRWRLGARIWEQIRLDLDGNVFAFSGDEDDTGFSLVASGYGLSAGYRLNSGYGGDLSGLVVQGHRSIGERWTVDACLNFNTYEYGGIDGSESVTPIDEDEASGLLAVGYRLHRSLNLTAQVEGLENAGFKRDVRFLGIVHWRFRTAL